MCLFFISYFMKSSAVYEASLCTFVLRSETMIWSSMRFDISLQSLQLISISKHSFLLFVDYSGVNLVSIRWPSPQCCLHKPVHPIKLTLSHSHTTVWVGSLNTMQALWNKFEFLQDLKEQDFKSCVMPREILSLSQCPTPRQYVQHTFGLFTSHSAHDNWSSTPFSRFPLVV